jgi:hypothetical protein
MFTYCIYIYVYVQYTYYIYVYTYYIHMVHTPRFGVYSLDRAAQEAVLQQAFEKAADEVFCSNMGNANIKLP